MTLSELLAEARELRSLYEGAEEEGLDSTANDYWNQLCTFWDKHGERLLRVAGAAVEMRGWLNTGHAYEGGCPDAVEPRSLDPKNCRCCASIVAFDRAARGDE